MTVSYSVPFAVSMMTGMDFIAESARTVRRISSPSMPGSIMSSRMSSGISCLHASKNSSADG